MSSLEQAIMVCIGIVTLFILWGLGWKSYWARREAAPLKRRRVGRRLPVWRGFRYWWDTRRRIKQIRSQMGLYNVVSKLNHGGNCDIFLATHRQETGFFALKLLREEGLTADAFEVRKRHLQEEGRLLTQIGKQDHIVRIHQNQAADTLPYLVLDYLEGETLETLLQRGALEQDQILKISFSICDALELIHALHYSHDDISPGNVMVVMKDSQVDKVIVIDLGQAMPWGIPGAENYYPPRTQVYGTVGFMPPEKLSGGRITAGADIFALGVLLLFMATGKAPESDDQVVAEIINLLQLHPEVRDPLRSIILQCTKSVWQDRPRDIMGVRNLLGPWYQKLMLNE